VHLAAQRLLQLLVMQQQQLQALGRMVTPAAAGVLCEGIADGKCGSSSWSGNRSLTLWQLLLLLVLLLREWEVQQRLWQQGQGTGRHHRPWRVLSVQQQNRLHMQGQRQLVEQRAVVLLLLL
jgi:hypothetical protein